ncbi:sensor histidine kinase [Agromyces marinus]|uniref:Histidine kinase/HSP90-like ATPase domain-containing protein n=1 Tax=Agromyces marinus TaxID=1389020 RepID=A0ABM8GZK8_9MICO|nr:ATP-binding protein [Agromyces marinus]UIP57903.1 hypothetical protein DSM26151_07700 [Agromyces marinus]BDZ53900.1 hypothetical protein GCM10025870_09730 [Agromyces marinus]
MTLGLPEHLARASLSRALTGAGHAAGAVCLASALAVAGASLVAAPGIDGAPSRESAILALTLLGGQALLFVLVVIRPNVATTVLALLGGTVAVFGLTVLVMSEGLGFESTNNAVLAMPRAALLLIGGAGIGSRIAIAWAGLGWGMGEAATMLGAAATGTPWVPSTAAAAALGILVVARVYDSLTRGEDRREAALHRASQQTRELAIRHDYELRAIARLHDTALSHLIAIAAAGSGPVDERLRAGIRHDLALIVGRDWAAEHGEDAGVEAAGVPGAGRAVSAAGAVRAAEDPGAALASVVAAAEEAGVAVVLTGDLDALALIGPRRREALASAVLQCLINVARHAGVDTAEVAVGPADGEVSVVVVDAGRGFDPDRVSEDRIGLRTSIRARIEQEGGTARVWSRPGIGTTVLLAVPEGGA